jgi:hypothetical protein
MTSIKNKIRIGRLQDNWSNMTSHYNPSFGLYPKNFPKNHYFSLSDVSTEKMIKHYYLFPFSFSGPFRDITCAIKRDSLIQETDALEVDMTASDPEEDYLLKLYRVWLVSIILRVCPNEPEYVYNYYKDRTLDELEEILDQYKTSKEEVQKPFWKFW